MRSLTALVTAARVPASSAFMPSMWRWRWQQWQPSVSACILSFALYDPEAVSVQFWHLSTPHFAASERCVRTWLASAVELHGSTHRARRTPPKQGASSGRCNAAANMHCGQQGSWACAACHIATLYSVSNDVLRRFIASSSLFGCRHHPPPLPAACCRCLCRRPSMRA